MDDRVLGGIVLSPVGYLLSNCFYGSWFNTNVKVIVAEPP
jgi:hypothetical protein